jgi:hypothetical protein
LTPSLNNALKELTYGKKHLFVDLVELNSADTETIRKTVPAVPEG